MCLRNLAKTAIVLPLRILPKEFLSRVMGTIADKRLPKIILRAWIWLYCKTFDVNMSESKKRIPEFSTFNEFFARELKSGARKIDSSKNAIISPVDGKITEFGKIENNILLQAKGKKYSLENLLEDTDAAKKFMGGSFMTIYLSPNNYHRIHSPISGKISGYSYIPGHLFPVGRLSLGAIDDLFAKNERLATYLEYQKYAAAVVKIGACIVGKICISYDAAKFNSSIKAKTQKKYPKKIPVKKGDEIGMFEIGSTIILLFEKNAAEFGGVASGMKIKMGEKIGEMP